MDMPPVPMQRCICHWSVSRQAALPKHPRSANKTGRLARLLETRKEKRVLSSCMGKGGGVAFACHRGAKVRLLNAWQRYNIRMRALYVCTYVTRWKLCGHLGGEGDLTWSGLPRRPPGFPHFVLTAGCLAPNIASVIRTSPCWKEYSTS